MFKDRLATYKYYALPTKYYFPFLKEYNEDLLFPYDLENESVDFAFILVDVWGNPFYSEGLASRTTISDLDKPFDELLFLDKIYLSPVIANLSSTVSSLISTDNYPSIKSNLMFKYEQSKLENILQQIVKYDQFRLMFNETALSYFTEWYESLFHSTNRLAHDIILDTGRPRSIMTSIGNLHELQKYMHNSISLLDSIGKSLV